MTQCRSYKQLGLSLLLTGISVLAAQNVAASGPLCTDLFKQELGKALAHKVVSSKITAGELNTHLENRIMKVEEFQFIRETAQKMGLRVWLFGGTASSFLHYAKWDLARSKGLMELQGDRFDYDFTNIFRSTQDLDIAVDAIPEVAKAFQNILAQRFPHFLGNKANKWEVRTLRHRIGAPGQAGFKEALLNDPDFSNQNSDSNSLGMVEITQSKEPMVRDLRHWDEPSSVFSEDTLNNRISFFRSNKHFTTFRAKAGENPEILSVIRLLVKAFQYELSFSDSDFKQMKEIVSQFDPSQVTHPDAVRRIKDTAKKLVLHAVNIEYAMNKLDELGLRQKLISMGDKNEKDSHSWWLNKEPLRSEPVGEGSGKTAEELGIQIVAHETNSFLAYESITRSHSGEPNVLISRENTVGENAIKGNGFYTLRGRTGEVRTGPTIRFTVDPKAREGHDFTIHDNIVLFKNKKALKVFPESLNFSLEDLLNVAQNKQTFEVDHSDLALLEKFKRKMTAAKITDELEKLLNSKHEGEFDRLIQILSSFQNSLVSKLVSKDVLNTVLKNIFSKASTKAHSGNESDITRYIKLVNSLSEALVSGQILGRNEFFIYLSELVQSQTKSFRLRRQAFYNLLLESDNLEKYVNIKKHFHPNQVMEIISEIKEWSQSTDARKSNFAEIKRANLAETVRNADLATLDLLVDCEIIDINHRNISGMSFLQLAAYYQHSSLIDWLMEKSEFDFNSKNALGFTEIEQLRLRGFGQLAQWIEQRRPEVRARSFPVKERNEERTSEYPHGTPIVDFVRMEPARFFFGKSRNKALFHITKPFEIMSVDTTQHVYKTVVELFHTYLSGEHRSMNPDPSHFKGPSRPVESVSFETVTSWILGLNKLSKMDNEKVQQVLRELLPGHNKGDIYDLPTEAQWEMVARLGGFAEGQYAHGDKEADLVEHAAYTKNSGSQTLPVGSKRPVHYNGKPVYDMNGLIWRWPRDFIHNTRLVSETDPIGNLTYGFRNLLGGSWKAPESGLLNEFRYIEMRNEEEADDVGFRLIRRVR